MNKLFAIPLLSLVIFSLASSASVFAEVTTPTTSNFPDVPTYDEYANEIKYAKSKNLASGFSDGNFYPDLKITRSQLLKLVVAAKYSTEDIDKCTDDLKQGKVKMFKDVDSKNKFYKFICLGRKEGIIAGKSDNSFMPDDYVTLAQAIKIVMRALDKDIKISSSASLQEYFDLMKSKDLLPPTATFPEQQITRAEAVYIIQVINDNYKKLDKEKQKAPYSSFSIKPNQVVTDVKPFTSIKIVNYGIFCKSLGHEVVELAIEKDTEKATIKLKKKCSGETIDSAEALGYKFKLQNTIEHEEGNPATFEYFIRYQDKNAKVEEVKEETKEEVKGIQTTKDEDSDNKTDETTTDEKDNSTTSASKSSNEFRSNDYNIMFTYPAFVKNGSNDDVLYARLTSFDDDVKVKELLKKRIDLSDFKLYNKLGDAFIAVNVPEEKMTESKCQSEYSDQGFEQKSSKKYNKKTFYRATKESTQMGMVFNDNIYRVWRKNKCIEFVFHLTSANPAYSYNEDTIQKQEETVEKIMAYLSDKPLSTFKYIIDDEED